MSLSIYGYTVAESVADSKNGTERSLGGGGGGMGVTPIKNKLGRRMDNPFVTVSFQYYI